MRTVRDEDGTRYLLLSESSDSSRVREVETGEERYVPNDRLTVVEGASPLATAARTVPDDVRRLLLAVRDDRALGLLVVLTDGPVSVRQLLADTDLCESDLHGLVGEFRAAGLIEETEVGGERGYALTDEATNSFDSLRDVD